MNYQLILFITTGVFLSLVIGLYFAFWIAANLGLEKLNDKDYLRAMQSINREIQNPVFLIILLGSPLLLVTATISENNSGESLLPLIFSTLFLTIGFFGLTVVKNVPLNEKLDKISLEDQGNEELSEIRSWYQGPWNYWHRIRTTSGIIALILFYYAGFG